MFDRVEDRKDSSTGNITPSQSKRIRASARRAMQSAMRTVSRIK